MASAEETSLPPAGWAGAGEPAPAAAAPRRRLFRKYALIFIALVGAALLINSGFDFWFSYQENKAALVRVQQEKAESAAQRITEFVEEIKSQIGWTTHAQWAAGPLDQRRQDYVRLLRQVPAITELSQLDGDGKEQLKVSRLAMDVVGSEADFSQSPAFTEAKARRVWFSPVYFRKESEPYMTLAMARDGRNAGVTVAEINLKLIWDVITALKIGQGGYAYVIDGRGRLIAHPDISLVLRDTDLSKLPQVAAALNPLPGEPAVSTADNLAGHAVLTANALIPQLGWRVFVELPLQEAFAPLYGAALRTIALLALGLIAATLVALVIARRMTGPIHAIAEGAERIGAGELGRRIDIHTGDELEGLAQQFNRMAGDLQKSYAELEQRVADRTAELSEALDQQTATAEVLGVINSSPGDLAPVFDAMLDKAMRLCDGAFGGLWTFDGDHYVATALRGVPAPYAEFLGGTSVMPGPGSAPYRFRHGERSVIQNIDLADEELYRASDPQRRALVDLGGARTALQVPLCRDDAVLGVITIYRQEVRPFSDKQVALLQNFAAQAVIAMENARLITETREALEQQTATAEVLGVINSSPGDLAPVWDAMLEKATRLCEAASGILWTYDGTRFRAVAQHGLPFDLVAETQSDPNWKPTASLEAIAAGQDLVRDDDLSQNREAERVVEEGGMRTGFLVALRKGEALLGAIRIFRREVRPFSNKQIALVQNFAAQAVIAMENARLITETREALEQQTATAEVLGVINSSPGDLTPVFDALLEKATGLCEAAFGLLLRYDGERYHAAALHDVPPAFAETWHEGKTPMPGVSIYRLTQGEDVVHIEDVTVENAYQVGNPIRRALADLGGARTALWVALRKDRTLLGAFVLYRQEVRPFAPKQIELVRTFAEQAVIAIENTRLITETRDALEQQTATAEVLGVINSSPGDLAPVLDAMLEKAMRLCDASFGSFGSFDGELMHAVAHRNVPAEVAEAMREPIAPTPGGHLIQISHGEEVVHIADFADTEAYRSGKAWAVALVDKGGARTAVWVALRKDDALLGALVIYRQQVRPFTDKQIALLQNFAAQAVIAMENARLITETREALEQQTATAEVLGVINSSPGELTPVFEAILEKAHALGGASRGTLFLFDGTMFRAAASHGYPEGPPGRPQAIAVSDDPRLAALLAGDPLIHIPDLAQLDDRVARAVAGAGGVRTNLMLPLRKDGALLGVLSCNRSEVRPFSDKQIALLRNFAAQAVIAMENARLLEELRGRTRDLQESLEYQTATSDVLKIISGSAFDLEPVLKTVVTSAIRLCRADHAGLYRNENGEYRWADGLAPTSDYEEHERTIVIRPGTGTLVGRVALEGRVVQIADAWTDPLYEAKEDVRKGGVHTLLGVPLLRDGGPIGVIGLARKRVELFSEKEIELVTTFADQAVIAIENARLLNELRERTDELARSVEELKTLAQVGQAVSSTLDLGAILSTILNRSVGLTEANAGVIFRYSQNRHVFRLVEAVGWEAGLAAQVRGMRIDENMTLMGEAVAHRAPAQIADLSERPGNMLRDAVLAAGYRSVLIVPLVGADQIFGALLLQRRRPGEFPEATVRLMQTLAAQSVLAIQNARLFREIADKSEQLALASQHKSQFLANMSHELRTPLNAILGYAELLVDGIYGDVPEKAMAVLERVQNNGKHLLALINDVLDLSKIEAGQLVLTFEDYALPDVVQSVVTATEALASTKGLKMTATVQPGLPMGHGDARRLSQVLLNLVGNAVKFTDEGEIAVGAMAVDSHFVLTVRDTGPGIAPEDHGKIFEEFQQVDSSNTRRKGGTGLGLAISKRMVEMQGGSIEVESQLGHGATFRVTLPIRVEQAIDELASEMMGAA